jgi:AmmeMemoRadiSam system protein A
MKMEYFDSISFLWFKRRKNKDKVPMAENNLKIQSLSSEEKEYLLTLARKAIGLAVSGKPRPKIDLAGLSQLLKANGASFVTLSQNKQLRGCIGTLEAYQPLALDVQEHAIAAALEDYRFPPVTSGELASIMIEISRLTRPQPLGHTDGNSLIQQLRPGIDGVILSDGMRRATFLPQVWEQLPNPEDFLSHLCHKMGANPDTWQKKNLAVSIYQVEEFHE